jgi:hypothetical protein
MARGDCGGKVGWGGKRVISVDTKNKELVDNFKNGDRVWREGRS